MNEILFKRNHDRPQRISYRNDVLFGATVHQGSKKRSRKKIHAGKKINKIYYRLRNSQLNVVRFNINDTIPLTLIIYQRLY